MRRVDYESQRVVSEWEMVEAEQRSEPPELYRHPMTTFRIYSSIGRSINLRRPRMRPQIRS